MDQTSSSTPAKILVIDDEPGLRQMLQFSLQKRGYDVSCAANGTEALALAAEHPFEVAICDIMMPGLNGIEVLSVLKERSPSTEIIIATGYATLETAIEAMKNGAFDYITKPYRLSHLSTLLEKALERRRLVAKVDHLEEVNRLKTEFMATMNHELRTPLASITGYVALLMKGIYGPLQAKPIEILRRVELNATNLLELINNILDLSKLSAEKMPLSPEPFTLDELAKEVVEAMESLAASKKLKLKCECSPSFWVSTDRTKLKQVLINLMGNAVKFTPEGEVALQIKHGTEPADVEICVEDTGIGIAAKDFPLLFQEFKQLDSSDTRAYKGTGLGLAISKKLVTLMGGTIRVESTLKKGSSFIINVPIAKERSTLPVPGLDLPVKDIQPGEEIILCIDDDPDILKILADSLTGTGFRFAGASTGEEGLQRARELRPHAITLDIMMPHMDGWSVFKALKSDPMLKEIPVYIVSIVDNKALGLSLGVSGYLLKPFSREDLLDTLKIAPKTTVSHVLVVDDDVQVCEAFTSALSQEGCDVQSLSSGEKAIEHLKQVRPDILFLDLMMPKVSGFDVLEAMGQAPGMESVTIIVMSEKELTREESNYLGKRVALVLQKRSMDLAGLVSEVKKKLVTLGKVA